MSDLVPDRFGEVVGWRAWRVLGGEKLPILASVTHSETVWHPDRWTHAVCGSPLKVKDHLCHRRNKGVQVPGESCSCGMYAAKSREQLVRLGYNHDAGHWPVLIGEVGLAGKVIPGSQGWRAEKGRIVRLFVPHVHFKLVAPLERLYRVPVLLDNTMRGG